LASSEGEQAFELAWIHQSPIVCLLRECALQLSRPDGWVVLASAGRIIWEHEPEDAKLLKERYGYSTLKQLVIATQMFEIKDEPTLKGFRTVYRLKTDDDTVSN
jgi:OST-HTH/LOTUS domain